MIELAKVCPRWTGSEQLRSARKWHARIYGQRLFPELKTDAQSRKPSPHRR